jgi:hypothetical protein
MLESSCTSGSFSRRDQLNEVGLHLYALNLPSLYHTSDLPSVHKMVLLATSVLGIGAGVSSLRQAIWHVFRKIC